MGAKKPALGRSQRQGEEEERSGLEQLAEEFACLSVGKRPTLEIAPCLIGCHRPEVVYKILDLLFAF